MKWRWSVSWRAVFAILRFLGSSASVWSAWTVFGACLSRWKTFWNMIVMRERLRQSSAHPAPESSHTEHHAFPLAGLRYRAGHPDHFSRVRSLLGCAPMRCARRALLDRFRQGVDTP